MDGLYLPWAGLDVGSDPLGMDTGLIGITAVLHGKTTRSVSVSVPHQLTCADLKGHLAVEGVVSSCGGLTVALHEDGTTLDDNQIFTAYPGQVVHLHRAAAMVHVTVLTTSAPGSHSSNSDDEVYELVLPELSLGYNLKEHIIHATANVLRPTAVFIAKTGDDEPYSVADDEHVQLADDQVIIVQKEQQPTEPVLLAPAAPTPPPVPTTAGGLLSSLRQKLMGVKSSPEGPITKPRLRCASNIKVKGAQLSCTNKGAWSGCAVFDVPDPNYFEISVMLLNNAPAAEAEGLTGRWMLGVVPAAAAEVNTETQRKRLLGLGYFLTVCHGHPAKLHAPSMPRGTCGEDCPALPGELQRGQRLTLRWAAGGSQSGTLVAQVDDGDCVALPYAPAPFDDVRPCLVMGGKPTEVYVVQLAENGIFGGA